MARLFGTDGVRGVAGEELTYELAYALGAAAVTCLGPEVIIGRDSRVSGPMLEDALCAGIASCGGTAHVTGIIPTPGIALLAAQGPYGCGIVISASHNPPEYNGIKFFSADGYKLPDAVEDKMQEVVEELLAKGITAPEERASREVVEDAQEQYIAHAVNVLREQGIGLEGIKIALDCAYGAAYETTPEALRQLGAEVIAINTEPDGELINVGCGSTHLEPVKALMQDEEADIALAHDGDADRLLAVAPDGTVVDGDYILAICALDMKQRGVLAANTVVGTVMANLGFMQAMEREGIDVVSTKVGDRYVLEEMRELGAVIGGEQSGHVILLEHNTTGDGLMTALALLAVVARSGKPLSELMQVMRKFPQSLVNVRVTDKSLYEGNEVIADAEQVALEELGDSGRLLIRASGTEPLIRVMIEATTQEDADRIANQLADVVREQIGA